MARKTSRPVAEAIAEAARGAKAPAAEPRRKGRPSDVFGGSGPRPGST